MYTHMYTHTPHKHKSTQTQTHTHKHIFSTCRHTDTNFHTHTHARHTCTHKHTQGITLTHVIRGPSANMRRPTSVFVTLDGAPSGLRRGSWSLITSRSALCPHQLSGYSPVFLPGKGR